MAKLIDAVEAMYEYVPFVHTICICNILLHASFGAEGDKCSNIMLDSDLTFFLPYVLVLVGVDLLSCYGQAHAVVIDCMCRQLSPGIVLSACQKMHLEPAPVTSFVSPALTRRIQCCYF